MRIDEDYIIFKKHHEWYTFVIGQGYVPTDDAPQYIKDAIERYNKTQLFLKSIGR